MINFENRRYTREGLHVEWPGGSAPANVICWCPTGVYVALADGRAINALMSKNALAVFVTGLLSDPASVFVPGQPEYYRCSPAAS